MKIAFTKTLEQLNPYISSFWVYESEFGVPATDARIVVPNGTAKILIPIKNPLIATVGQKTMMAKEHHIHLAGLSENPTKISGDAKQTITLGMQLTPKGLYHLFNVNMHEATDQLFTFEDIFGAWGARLQHMLANIENAQEKISFIQNALVYLLDQNTKDYSLLDHAIDIINASHGLFSIKELEEQTGYSKRYLDLLFKEHIGVSPKRLASIARFHIFYQLWAKGKSKTFFKDSLYNYYYDQSHFIKEFKRFTGFSPQKFAEIKNEFGRIFYSQ
jgi:AraC-like DNA-binding protein